MRTIDDLPRVPDVGWMGSFGLRTPERLAFQLDLARRSDPLVRGRILHLPLVLPCTPEACHEVLVAKAKSFEKSPGLRVLLSELAGEGLFTSEGALWKRQRRLMSPLFQPAPLVRYADTMRIVAERAADELRDGQAIDVAHETTRIAMSVVGKALFDADTFDEADALGAALTTCLAWVNAHLASPMLVAHVLAMDATELFASRTEGGLKALFERAHEEVTRPFTLPGVRDPKLRTAVRLLDERVQAMIDERRRQGLAHDDLLTRLLSAQDPESGGAPMSDKQVRDEAITLFVAGHETTATSLAWCFYLLARHPEVQARARAEADAYVEASRGAASWQPERLALCSRIFREAMRLYPPVMMFPRRTVEEVEIAGTRIPRRRLVFVSAYAQHHREDTYPEPVRFDPDRFLPEREEGRPKGAYIPFGLGPRFCLGSHFALMEGPIVLATLLSRWHFEIDPSRVIEPDDFATLRPRGGVPAVVRRRG